MKCRAKECFKEKKEGTWLPGLAMLIKKRVVDFATKQKNGKTEQQIYSLLCWFQCLGESLLSMTSVSTKYSPISGSCSIMFRLVSSRSFSVHACR